MRHPAWVTVLCLFFAVAVEAQTTESGAVYAVPTGPDRLGRVLVPVTINGRGPFRFLVDTGSTGTFVGLALAGKLGIAPPADGSGSRIRVHDVLGDIIAQSVHLDRFDLGLYAETDLTLPMLPIRDSSGAAGVFGVEGLAGRRLWVDFQNDQISIEPSRSAAPVHFDRLAGTIDKGGLMVVTTEMDGVAAPTLVDTGAERTIVNDAMLKAMMAGGRTPSRIGEASLINLFGAVMPGTFYLIDRLDLGRTSISNLPIVVVDPSLFKSWGHAQTPAIVLGMDVLGRADDLVLDYGQAAFYVRFPSTQDDRARFMMR